MKTSYMITNVIFSCEGSTSKTKILLIVVKNILSPFYSKYYKVFRISEVKV